MSPRCLPQYAIILMVLGWLNGCTPPGGERPLIGELGTAGPNVLHNGMPAPSGTRIYSGDSVTTGPDSSAMILFANGGYFQLDQNTDPFFSWETLGGVRCILVKLVRGQSYVDDTHTCISSPAADALTHSMVNISVSESTSVLTLLGGALTLERPQLMTLAPGQEVTADGGAHTTRVRSLSPAELEQRIAWRFRFQFRGWCNMPGGTIPASFGECRGRFSFAQAAVAPPPSFGFSPFFPFPRMGPRFPTTRQPQTILNQGCTSKPNNC
jgi:hypothetical protein